MKKHTRNLLFIIPLLPLVMANSPAPQREEYKDIEITYKSVESLHGYNFYHFNLKNIGEGYIDYVDIHNKPDESPFYANTESNEISHPFNSVFIEPGFDKEIIVVSKNTIPESKEVVASSYTYYVQEENISFQGSKHVAYSVSSSSVADNYFAYNIQAFYSGATDSRYDYRGAAYFTYKGEHVCVKLNSIDTLSFVTNEKLDLDQLVLDDLVVLRSSFAYNNYYDDYDVGNAISTLLVFLLIFFIILGFGIFSAIFFPAMARRRRKKALLEQENK